METEYKGKLRCVTCGSDSQFEMNEDKSYVKCTSCNREYLGGYDELLELNVDTIAEVRDKIAEDAKKEIIENLKQAFKGNKNINFK